MSYIKLIYLTVYNHYIANFDYDKDSIKNAKFNYSSATTNMVISGSIVFMLIWVYKAISGDKINLRLTTSRGLFPFLCCYLLLYLYFQKYNDLHELYDGYLDLPENRRKKWKIITVLFFISCFLSGFLLVVIREPY